MGGRFYVYELIDPRDGKTFYVGKGTGNRIERHEAEARRSVISKKCDRIRDIWAQNLSVTRKISRRFNDEVAAYAYERRLISKIGRKYLTNLNSGGGAPRGEQPEIPFIERHDVGGLLLNIIRHMQMFGKVDVLGRDLTSDFKRFFRGCIDRYGVEAVIKCIEPHDIRIDRTTINNAF